jgi:tRNA (guanine26-N2/guanine27-N2)-dimethyltransferase
MKKKSLKMEFPTEIVHEGRVQVRVPKLSAFVESPSEYAPSKAPVFYNPVMEFNRDIAVLAMQAYQKKLHRKMSICEPLTGCGVRGLRFAKEVKGVKRVVINDLNTKAFQLANYNVHMNELTRSITVSNEDANSLLAIHGAPRQRFDVIDIDPFGPPIPFLDSAIRALRNNGLLMLTATDKAPLCGVHPRACIRKYGAKPLRTEYCQELAIRLLAGSLARASAKYDLGTRIVLSHSTKHYIRIYAILEHGAEKANENIKEIGYVIHCFECLHREAFKQKFLFGHLAECSECESRMNVVGPLWLGRIVDKQFCKSVEEEARQKPFKLGGRIRKMLTLLKNEAEAPITYFVIDRLCSALSLPVPPVQRVLEALREDGFQACLTHFDPRGIKSDASADQIKEILQEIVHA